jgi:hypothetical protein
MKLSLAAILGIVAGVWLMPYIERALDVIRRILVVFFLLFSGCAASPWTVSTYHGATVLVGDRLRVESECLNRGVVVPSVDTRVLGCTDFTSRTIVTIPDARIFKHEACHWDRWTGSHEECPTPRMP